MAKQRGSQALADRFGRIFKMRFAGIGFVWAWLTCSYETTGLFTDRTGLSFSANESWLISAATVIVMFFAGGVLLRQYRPKALSPLTVGAPLALSVGTALSVAGGMGSAAAMWAGGVLTGVGYALLSILWAQALLQLEVEELEVVIPLSTLVPLACAFVIPPLQGLAAAFATALLPLVSGGLLMLCLSGSEGGDEAPAEADGGNARAEVAGRIPPWLSYLLRVSVLLGVIYVAIGWLSACGTLEGAPRSSSDFAALISSVITVVLVVLLVLFSRKVSFAGLFRWLMPLVIVSLVLFGLPDAWADFVGSELSAVCDTLVEVLLYLFVLTLAKSQNASVSLGVGLANGFVQLGVLGGNLLARASLAPDAAMGLGETEALLICLVALAMAFIPQREPGVEPSALAAPTSHEEAVLRACRHLQERFGLSDRETEIAALLAQGRTRPYIREQLFISSNTVATHIKHIYQKLDIHSKEELMDLVAQEE